MSFMVINYFQFGEGIEQKNIKSKTVSIFKYQVVKNMQANVVAKLLAIHPKKPHLLYRLF